MMIPAALLVGALLLQAHPSQEPVLALPGQDPDLQISPDLLLDDLGTLREELERNHPGLHRYTTPQELDRAFQDAFERLDRPMDSLAFFRILAPVLARIRCGHTLTRPGGEALGVLMQRGRQLPFEVRLFGEEVYVANLLGGATDPPPGARLLSIAGRPMAEIRAKILAALPADGFIETGKLREAERNFALYYLVHVDAGASDYDVRFVPPGATEPVQLTVQGTDTRPPRSGTQGKPLEFEIREDFALLTVRTFSSAAMSRAEIDYPAFLERCFRALRAEGIDRLAIDLRGNRGGTDGYGALLVSHLSPVPFRYFDRIEVTPDYEGEGGIRTDDSGRRLVTTHEGLKLQPSSPGSFEGHLVLLIDGDTFSTAADVAAVVHHLGLARFVGEESGGGYEGNTSGTPHRFALEHSGIQVSIPLWMYTTANPGHDLHGRGVPVDRPAEATIEDLIAGRDPALEIVASILTAR